MEPRPRARGPLVIRRGHALRGADGAQGARYRPTLTTDEILEALHRLGSDYEQCYDGYRAQCPVHDDVNPSLHLTETDGSPLLYCFAGCDYFDIRDVLEGAL